MSALKKSVAFTCVTLQIRYFILHCSITSCSVVVFVHRGCGHNSLSRQFRKKLTHMMLQDVPAIAWALLSLLHAVEPQLFEVEGSVQAKTGFLIGSSCVVE